LSRPRAEYTDGEAYTGRSHGSLTGGYCEGPRIGSFLLSGIAFVFYLIASIGGVAVVTARSQPIRKFTSYLAFGVFAGFFANGLLHYEFTPPLARVYSVPDVLLSVVLLGVVALEYGLVRTLLDDVERTEVLALLLVNAPLVASALLYPL
jgi:hypothetical protein